MKRKCVYCEGRGKRFSRSRSRVVYSELDVRRSRAAAGPRSSWIVCANDRTRFCRALRSATLVFSFIAIIKIVRNNYKAENERVPRVAVLFNPALGSLQGGHLVLRGSTLKGALYFDDFWNLERLDLISKLPQGHLKRHGGRGTRGPSSRLGQIHPSFVLFVVSSQRSRPTDRWPIHVWEGIRCWTNSGDTRV